MKTVQTNQQPALAIVIPVFKHSVFVAEALECALHQEASFDIRVVVVNDGCPYPETHETCASFARAYPGKVAYLHSRNGGLSAARNIGIEYALKEWPSIQAIYLLDADNRLLPYAMQNAMDVLAKNNYEGWVYPDIDMFGYRWMSDFGGEYSVLAHLANNICEAGSMVSRKLLDKGLRFDESMKLGYEDWEFWLQAIASGARGAHCSNFGFQYRKRAESMLSDSDRDSAEILSYMQRKHSTLFKPKTLVALEQKEAPRFAIFLEDTGQFYFTTDPAQLGESMSPAEFRERWWMSLAAPNRYPLPAFLVVTNSRVLEAVSNATLLHWVFWRLEDALSSKVFAFSSVRENAERGHVRVEDGLAAEHLKSDIAMVKVETLGHAVNDPLTTWIDSLLTEHPHMPFFNMRITCGFDGEFVPYKRAVNGLLSRFRELRDSSQLYAADMRWNWKDPGIPRRSNAYLAMREISKIEAPILPRVFAKDKKNVAFVLPLIKFGGVEKVAFAVAMEMAKAGWDVHFVVLDSAEVSVPDYMIEHVSSIMFLKEESQPQWGGQPYLGTADDQRNKGKNHGRLLGLLNGMDLVVNAHGALANGAMGKLRRLGAKTANHLHVIDLAECGRPVGHPYLGLAYEHAYDYFLTCSQGLAHWLHGMGVPAGKLIPVPNGPGYPMTKEVSSRAWASRKFDTDSRKLRVLFIGRLDRQKGLERVVDVLRLTKQNGMGIEWRLVGASVIADQAVEPEVEDILSEFGRQAVYDPNMLTEQYRWADVVLMPSHWEGLPLTIIEAMRVGCAVISTSVGAVDELIAHDENGILLDTFSATDCVSQLKDLQQPVRLKKIASAAYASANSRSWENATKTLLSRVEAATQPVRV